MLKLGNYNLLKNMKKIGILVSRVVVLTLTKGFHKHGYEVTVGSREKKEINGWDGPVATFVEVAKSADIVVLAVKGMVAEKVVENVKTELSGKTVIDASNPISELPPTEGVLHFFTTLEESLMERLQKLSPKANFVKAFNSVGNAFMVNPDFDGHKPTMFICGNDENAKKEVAVILDQFGFEVEDMGSQVASRAIEPLCMLWCIPGFLRNDWSHAFKMLKK